MSTQLLEKRPGLWPEKTEPRVLHTPLGFRDSFDIPPLRLPKMHGLLNTYFVLNDIGGNVDDALREQGYHYGHLGFAISPPAFGFAPDPVYPHKTGSDGILVLRESSVPDAYYEMIVVNQDGTRAQMCGNGIRIIARYIFDRLEYPPISGVDIATLAGTKFVDIAYNEPRPSEFDFLYARVNMGKPVIEKPNMEITVKGVKVVGDYGNIGNEHIAIFKGEWANEGAVKRLGPEIEHHSAFKPKRTNVEVARIVDRGSAERPALIYLGVKERGVDGLSYACGTGASYTAYVAYRRGLVDSRKIIVQFIGSPLGEAARLKIEVREGDLVLMTGPADYNLPQDVELPLEKMWQMIAHAEKERPEDFLKAEPHRFAAEVAAATA